MRKPSPLAAAAAWLVVTLAAAGCQTTRRDAPIYRVRVEKGDTLASIAAKYDTSWQKLEDLNELKDGEALKVGRILRVQPGPGGLVAGADAVRSGKSGRLAKAPKGAAASAAEFDESDLPEADGAATGGKGAAKPTGKKRKGLFFSGDSDGDAADAGEDGASLVWPIHGEVSSAYGQRHGRKHAGIDIRSPQGTEIGAAAPGTVEFSGRKNGYGKVVVVRHGGLKTLYAHMSRIDVSEGDAVDAGSILGEVGQTGNASGPHLHFEVRGLDDKTRDPLGYLSQRDMLSSTSH
jgi:murein DD-endopeptidase MepM/ murein hydrolase activator NlpD